MLEEIIGKIGWPIIALLALLMATGVVVDHNNDSKRNHLQLTIVEKCATQANPVECTKQMTGAVNQVK